MRPIHAIFSLLLLIIIPPTAAQEKRPSPNDIIEAAPEADWRMIDTENTLYLDLAEGRVTVELAPAFAPNSVANFKALVREGFYDGLSIYRVAEGFVAQGGDATETKEIRTAQKTIAPEFYRSIADGLNFTALTGPDGFAPEAGYSDGFPAARNLANGESWLVHCPGAFALARGNEPDSGGTEFYAVIGHAPRYLDRNTTIFGRVIEGMEVLQRLNRGSPPAGFIAEEDRKTPIVKATISADLPQEERKYFQIMRTSSASFQALIKARADRPEEWFQETPGYVDVCGVPIPVREIPAD